MELVGQKYDWYYDTADEFVVIDRYTGDAQILPLTDIEKIDFVPFFDEDGRAVFMWNTRYESSEIFNKNDYYLYNSYVYYSWDNAAMNKVEALDGKPILYLDPESMIVMGENSFDKLSNGGNVWSIPKENYTNAHGIIQCGGLWMHRYSSYHVYLVSEEVSLPVRIFDQEITLYSTAQVGFTGRLNAFHAADYILSLQCDGIFDQMTYEVHNLVEYNCNGCMRKEKSKVF